MPDETPDDLKPAEENIWYRLMTFHGVVEDRFSDEGQALHARNRDLWNRWALPALNGERIEALGLTDLSPLTEQERQDMTATLGIEELPDPYAHIDMSETRFSAVLIVDGFVFPGYASFEAAHFEDYASFGAAHFKRTADFSAAHFEVYATFKTVHFADDAGFYSAHFEAYADFSAAHFEGYTYFSAAHFERSTDFSAAHFEGSANFGAAYFEGPANFSDGNFKAATTFDRVAFAWPPLFHQAKPHQDTSFHEADFDVARAVVNDNAARAWQRLKVIMNGLHAHDQELRFFAYEMSVRGRMARWPVNWLYALYEGLSDYGRSMGLPVVWLAMLTVVFGLAYHGILDQPNRSDRAQFREDVASFTLGNVLPADGGLCTRGCSTMAGASTYRLALNC